MPLLNVALVPAPDQVVVRVTGEADLSTTSLLADALAQAGGLRTRQVVVDVAGVRFWDLSCLYVLTEFTADLAAFGHSCRIVGAPPATRRLISLAGLADGLNLDGPLRELPAPIRTGSLPVSRRPVPEHPLPRRASGGLVPAGGTPMESVRRLWRRRDR